MEHSETSSVEKDGSDKEMPAVFQCQSCNVIVSDSTSFAAAHDDLKSITVNRVNPSVDLSTKLITSRGGVDEGSTFSPLICNGCKAVLGKVYRTTPRSLDDLRDCYTFDVNKISVYQVGSCNSSAIPESDCPFQQFTNMRVLKETTLKLQVLMCAMHQRILNIEQALEIEDTTNPDNALQSLTGLLGAEDTLSRAHQPLVNGASTKGAKQLKNTGRDPDVLPGSRRDVGRYPTKDASRNDTLERNGSIYTSSESESSRASASVSSGPRKGKGTTSKAARGKGSSAKVRVESDRNQTRGTKRAKDFGDLSGEQGGLGIELLSPIRKKSSTGRKH